MFCAYALVPLKLILLAKTGITYFQHQKHLGTVSQTTAHNMKNIKRHNNLTNVPVNYRHQLLDKYQ